MRVFQVGHLNIGAGRVIYQDIVRINLAVKNNTLVKFKIILKNKIKKQKIQIRKTLKIYANKNNLQVKNEALIAACERAKNGTKRLHLCGLVSDGGVHSHIGDF